MLPRFARLTILTAVVGLLAVPAVHAGPHVFVQIGIPAPVIAPPVYAPPVYAPPVYGPAAVVAPYPGYFWRAGYYAAGPYGRRWVAGGWVPRARYYGGWGGRGHWDRGYARGYYRHGRR